MKFKDKLTWSGFRYLGERSFASHGVRIEVVDGEEPKDAYQELVDDLISLVSGFAGKMYGLRSHKCREVWLKVSGNLLLSETCSFKLETYARQLSVLEELFQSYSEMVKTCLDKAMRLGEPLEGDSTKQFTGS